MEQHKFGCNKVPKDLRDYKLKISKSEILPKQYIIANRAKIKSQGSVNSCVAHALSSFEEYLHNNNFSTNFIYGYRPISYFSGEGMNIRDALHTLLYYGDCLYDICPGNLEVPDVVNAVLSNSEKIKECARPYTIKSYARIFTARQIKECLLKDIPVPISIPVRNDLYVKNGIITYDKSIPIDGYHCMLVIGYNEDGYIVQNSWGTYWGINGTAILPYSYPLDSAWALNTQDNLMIKEPIRWLAVIGNFIYNLLNRFTK